MLPMELVASHASIHESHVINKDSDTVSPLTLLELELTSKATKVESARIRKYFLLVQIGSWRQNIVDIGIRSRGHEVFL